MSKLSNPIKHLVLFYMLIACLALAAQEESAAAKRDREVENLSAFSRLYGYVRFFHPSDEAAALDWSKFAVLGAEKVKAAPDKTALRQTLNELFLPVAPSIRVFETGTDPGKPKPNYPDNPIGLEKVAWQHIGVGLGGRSNTYRSIRVNRKNVIPAPEGYGYGVVAQSIDAESFRGRKVKYSAQIRSLVEGPRNLGQLWIRANMPDPDATIFKDLGDKPSTEAAWKTYEIEMDVPAEATTLTLGCYLRGEGKSWFDDFQLKIQKDTGNWETFPIPNTGMEDSPSDTAPWQSTYPGYDYLIDADEKTEGKHSLLIKPTEEQVFTGTLFAETPEIGEVIQKPIGAGLSCQVPLALYSDENETLGKNAAFPFESLKQEVEAIDFELRNSLDLGVKLADVIITWNVFQHFHPYFDLLEVDWEKQQKKALRECLEDTLDLAVILKQMLVPLKDGHINVSTSADNLYGYLPLHIVYSESKFVVLAGGDTDKLKRGDVLISIDGSPLIDLFKKARLLISGSPQWRDSRALQELLKGFGGTEAEVVFERNGKQESTMLPRGQAVFRETWGHQAIEKLDGDIYYVDLSKASLKEIQDQLNEIAAAKGVVFDLRGYPNSNHQILQHLIDKPVRSALFEKPQIIYPDRERLLPFNTDGRWTLEPAEPRIQGKVVFLAGTGSISYAESVMGIVEHEKLATIVGQPTAGANGNVNTIPLPGGITITWTGMRVRKTDGSQHHLIGIQPSVPVDYTISDLQAGRDTYLEKALEIIKGK